jgi:ATP dependent DNA ligase domain
MRLPARSASPAGGDQRGSSSAVRGWGALREPSLPTQQQFHLFVPYIRKPICKVRSCLIDGEMVYCDEQGVTSFQLLRHRRNEPQAFLYTFDLLELNGDDLRREPIEVRKATLASILRKA